MPCYEIPNAPRTCRTNGVVTVSSSSLRQEKFSHFAFSKYVYSYYSTYTGGKYAQGLINGYSIFFDFCGVLKIQSNYVIGIDNILNVTDNK